MMLAFFQPALVIESQNIFVAAYNKRADSSIYFVFYWDNIKLGFFEYAGTPNTMLYNQTPLFKKTTFQ